MADLITNIQGYSIHDGPGIRTVVFFKGCGLACQWCSNPECISGKPEMGFLKALCTKCLKCDGICPAGALSRDKDQYPVIDRKLCTGCGACAEVCAYHALVLYGKPMTADEIFDAVSPDKMFYETSGGGVTVSGGEALLHPQLVAKLLEKCHRAGISTCIETSGYAPEASLVQVLPLTDHVLFDIKLMDTNKHEKYTGQPNALILNNARRVAQSGVGTLFRLPLIPGINDDNQNIKETAEFLHGLGKYYERIELMPYHRLGKGKYDSLGKAWQLPDVAVPIPEHIEAVKKVFEGNGIACSVSR
jgi:pyruvate formate lyase activating enzyme